MRILYLLEDTDLSGGVRVALGQADALIAKGHRVTIATKGEPLTWRTSRAEWQHVDHFQDLVGADFDFVIGTFWKTVTPAVDLAGPRAVHLCQGYEGDFDVYRDRKREIDEVYSLPIPKLVVAGHLVPIVRRFHDDVTCVGQIVEEAYYRPHTPSLHDPPRVLLAGPAQVEIKGIDDGYGAVNHARWHGRELDLIRVSPWRPSDAEPVDQLVQEFRVALNTNEMIALVHSCDLYLGPNRKEEGFGLVAAEAMAAGIPCVLTRIPSYLAYSKPDDYAHFAEENDAEDLGEKLMEVLDGEDLRKRLTRRGREVASQFRAEEVAKRIEEALEKRAEILPAR